MKKISNSNFDKHFYCISDLDTAPMAYPLPYGEYLGEVEALHLILAHDLYTELRSLISHIQVIQNIPVVQLEMTQK